MEWATTETISFLDRRRPGCLVLHRTRYTKQHRLELKQCHMDANSDHRVKAILQLFSDRNTLVAFLGRSTTTRPDGLILTTVATQGGNNRSDYHDRVLERNSVKLYSITPIIRINSRREPYCEYVHFLVRVNETWYNSFSKMGLGSTVSETAHFGFSQR